MTPAADVYMLPDTTQLDYEVLVKVAQSGHSRVPVYKEVDVPDLVNAGKTRRIKRILGILLVKNLLLVDPEGAFGSGRPASDVERRC
jgi:metal transporter CNNM